MVMLVAVVGDFLCYGMVVMAVVGCGGSFFCVGVAEERGHFHLGVGWILEEWWGRIAVGVSVGGSGWVPEFPRLGV